MKKNRMYRFHPNSWDCGVSTVVHRQKKQRRVRLVSIPTRGIVVFLLFANLLPVPNGVG